MRTITMILALVSALPVLAQEAFDPGLPPPTVASDYYRGAEKAVYHVTTGGDEKHYLAILGSLRNHHQALAATGVRPELKVVINGDGIRMLTLAQELEFDVSARLPGAIKDAKERGVQFQVCYNTLVGYQIKFSDLFDAKAEDMIPAGVAEVARLQRVGYGLVKP